MTRHLKDWIEAYLLFTAEQETPESIHRPVAWTMLSAALQRQVYIERPGYKLYTNLYVIIVGSSGDVRKSTGVDIGLSLLREALPESNVISGKSTPEGLGRHMNRLVGGSNDEPPTKRSDVLIHADELATFFGYDKPAAMRMLTFLTQTYGCTEHYDHLTKTDGRLKLENLYPVFIAATDPRGLRVIPSEASVGFTGRVMYITSGSRRHNVAWPNRDPEWLDRQKKLRTKLVHDLARISELEHCYEPTAEAQDLYSTWYDRHSERLRTNVFNDVTLPFARRAHDTLLKLSMIFAAAEGDSPQVTADHIGRATRVIEEQLGNASSVLAWTGSTTFEQQRSEALHALAFHGGTMLPRDLLTLVGIPHIEFDSLVTTLARGGLIEMGGTTWSLTPRGWAYVGQTKPRADSESH